MALLYLICAVLLMRVTAAAYGSTVVLDWTPGSNISFVPGPGNLLQYWAPLPGVIFNNVNVTVDSRKAVFASNPHKATVAPSESGTFDHVKFLALSSATFAPVADKKLVYEMKFKAKSFIPKNLPSAFTRQFIKKPQDDVRIGGFSTNLIDFSIMLVADIFLTNEGVWALYERLPFLRNATYNYAAFTYIKKIASRKPGDVHTVKTIYDAKKNSVKYVVDGKTKYEVTKLGYKPPKRDKAVAVLDLGGIQEVIRPTGFVAGFGSFTVLDFADPNQPHNPASGLVKLNTPAGYYTVPTKFATESSDVKFRLFGQGTVGTVKKMRVYYQ